MFYEVFRFLEEAMKRHSEKPLGQMMVSGMSRTEAFEKDLAYYLGHNWKKDYVVRPAVGKYIAHLQSLEKDDPNILIAYVYHLYMGLLSGGQILAKKRALSKKLFFSSQKSEGGENLTDFRPHNIYNIKCAVVKTINSLTENMDQSLKDKILEESKQVFLLNNEIVGTIEGAREVLLKKLFIAIFIGAILASILYYYLFARHTV